MSKQKMSQFIYVIEAVRPELVTDPNAWTEEELRIGKAHFAYLKQATEEGTVLLAGRAQDGVGPAIVIFEAPSEGKARQFMEGDPFIASGLMRGRLHPFRATLVRNSQVGES